MRRNVSILLFSLNVRIEAGADQADHSLLAWVQEGLEGIHEEFG